MRLPKPCSQGSARANIENVMDKEGGNRGARS
jgi:hypothetical protein